MSRHSVHYLEVGQFDLQSASSSSGSSADVTVTHAAALLYTACEHTQDKIVLPAGSSIVSATYGAVDDNRGIDVTAVVRNIVRQGKDLRAHNTLFGDPSRGKKKILRVEACLTQEGLDCLGLHKISRPVPAAVHQIAQTDAVPDLLSQNRSTSRRGWTSRSEWKREPSWQQRTSPYSRSFGKHQKEKVLHHVSAQEHTKDIISIPDRAEVTWAFYGDAHACCGRDVTRSVRYLHQRWSHIYASNDLFGDPLPGKRKWLFVSFFH